MTKAVEHTPGGFEQQVIQNLRLIEAQLVKSIRQCKDHMKIRVLAKVVLVLPVSNVRVQFPGT